MESRAARHAHLEANKKKNRGKFIFGGISSKIYEHSVNQLNMKHEHVFVRNDKRFCQYFMCTFHRLRFITDDCQTGWMENGVWWSNAWSCCTIMESISRWSQTINALSTLKMFLFFFFISSVMYLKYLAWFWNHGELMHTHYFPLNFHLVSDKP